jgi:hypothetical protein
MSPEKPSQTNQTNHNEHDMIEQGEANIPVTEILRSQDGSFTSEEKQNVMQKVALMAQLEKSDVKMESNGKILLDIHNNRKKTTEKTNFKHSNST